MEPRTNFYGLCLSGFLAKASYALARTPVLALFAASFGVGPEAIGFAVAISTITGVFFKMPAGVISDIIGRRRTMLIGLVFFAVIPFLYLLVHSYNSLLIVRFLHGFATAIYGPVIMAVVVDMAGNRRGEMLSLFSSVTIIGNLVGAPLGGFLLGRLAGGGEQQLVHFHSIYGVVAALGMIALLIGIWASSSLTANSTNGTGKSTVSAVISHFWHSLKNILTDRRIVVTSNMEGVQNLSVGALEAFMPIYIVMVLGYSVFLAGLLIGLSDGQDFRLAFACIAAILVISALLFRRTIPAPLESIR